MEFTFTTNTNTSPKIEGCGKLVCSKYTLEGNFHNGFMEGKGKKTDSNGAIYEGDFQQGLPWGKGKDTYSNGAIYEGDRKSGLHGGRGEYSG